LVWLFLDFSTISYGFYKLTDLNLERGADFHRKAPGKIQILAIGSLAKLHRKTDRCRSNSDEGAHRRRGASEGKCSGTHVGYGGGRCQGREGLWRRIDGEQRRAVELRGTSTVFRWPEGRRAVEE
jgi:hypothetical protein